MKTTILLKCFIFVVLSLNAGCDYALLERDNPLDPKNPESVRTRLSLVELFVNEYTDNETICAYAEEAVHSIAASDFSGRIVVIQYHVHKNQTYADDFSSQVASVAELTDRYDLLRDGRAEGLPDIYVNGSWDSLRANNVQGASGTESVKARLNSLLNSEAANSCFTIEGSITKTNQPVMTITIAKLGAGDAVNMTLKCAFLENIKTDDRHHYVVRDLTEKTDFTLNASESVTYAKEGALIQQAIPENIYGAAWIENADGLVLQSAFVY